MKKKLFTIAVVAAVIGAVAALVKKHRQAGF